MVVFLVLVFKKVVFQGAYFSEAIHFMVIPTIKYYRT